MCVVDADASLKTLALEADLGNFEPLSQYLLSDEPLTTEDRELLAWLIVRRLPKGASNIRPSARRLALACAAYLLWQGKMALRDRDLAETKMAARDALIRATINLVETEFSIPAGSLTIGEVVKVQKHGGSRTIVDYVRDHMPGATQKVRTLALSLCKLDTSNARSVVPPSESLIQVGP